MEACKCATMVALSLKISLRIRPPQQHITCFYQANKHTVCLDLHLAQQLAKLHVIVFTHSQLLLRPSGSCSQLHSHLYSIRTLQPGTPSKMHGSLIAFCLNIYDHALHFGLSLTSYLNTFHGTSNCDVTILH